MSGQFNQHYFSAPSRNREVEKDNNFYKKGICEMNIELTNDEKEFLRIVLYAELKVRGDAVVHALSHGSRNYDDPGMVVIQGIIDKLNNGE